MKRFSVVFAAAALALSVVPAASAHPQTIQDGIDDAYVDGDISTQAFETPLDIIGAQFNETKKNYLVQVQFNEPVPPSMFCNAKDCATPSDAGIVYADFYIMNKKKGPKNYYTVDIYGDGAGGLVAVLYKLGNNGNASLVGNVNAAMTNSDTILDFVLKRNKLKGHDKGKKLQWNARSLWFSAEGDCAVDEGSQSFYGGGCVDWIPETQDAKHKLKK